MRRNLDCDLHVGGDLNPSLELEHGCGNPGCDLGLSLGDLVHDLGDLNLSLGYFGPSLGYIHPSLGELGLNLSDFDPPGFRDLKSS